MATIETATKRSGNTKTERSKIARRYQLTLNDTGRYEELINYLLSLKSLKYLLSCKEKAPTTNHEHIHIYICFDKGIRLSVNKTCGAHIEVCNGSHKHNIDYIRKDGNILDEIGEVPRERGGSHTVQELKEIKNPDELDFKEYNTWEKIHSKISNDLEIEDFQKDVEVYYIQGPSGIGKTEKAKDIIRKNKNKYGSKLNIIKYENNFYIGVGEAPIALYDDFRDSHMKASEFINLIDYNKHPMNIKGGSRMNDYKLVIITSIQKIDEIYKHMPEEAREQWLRRCQIIDFYSNQKTSKEQIEDLDIDDI